MSFKYRYTGDMPTVFNDLKDSNGHTWVPNKGDTVISVSPVSHPLLELVTKETSTKEVIPDASGKPEPSVNEPAVPEKKQSPVTVDESKEN